MTTRHPYMRARPDGRGNGSGDGYGDGDGDGSTKRHLDTTDPQETQT
jgi:hypothetical protein